MADRDAYLVIRSKAQHAAFRSFCEAARQVIASHGGTEEASAGLHEVTALEPGSVPMQTYLARFPAKAAAADAWRSLAGTLPDIPDVPLVLVANAVPEAGYDDPSIPTIHSVASPPAERPVLMIIEGSATDQARMDRYRDIILPMMFERDGYYTVFELGGDVDVLSGSWDEAIFAISRWPAADAATGFWLSERYQKEAIPLRLDIGRFQVVIVNARTDG